MKTGKILIKCIACGKGIRDARITVKQKSAYKMYCKGCGVFFTISPSVGFGELTIYMSEEDWKNDLKFGHLMKNDKLSWFCPFCENLKDRMWPHKENRWSYSCSECYSNFDVKIEKQPPLAFFF